MAEADKIELCLDGEHRWMDLRETESRGPNLLGQIVTCKGWDTVCQLCVAMSWRRNNGTK